ncbi:ParB family protein [Entomohabitans teleogrylli]|uniref:ParB family protein n=1 Tax=Entomohabitans teleogrylli TaxID=1384589 RepID=UPI00073D88D6|nr:ParB family protein [Entomohabitans teleogrylli]
MTKKRVTIGRTLTPPSFLEEKSSDAYSSIFTLHSGKKVLFRLETVPAEEVEDKTFVVQEINGREQASLTPESLKDITRTFPFQQFFPAIGVRVDDRIEILDGSRRRLSAILCHRPLDVLVSDTPVSADDARRLAKDIQTAREHNLREIGMRLMVLRDAGMNQKDIAQDQGLSAAKVTRALQAASVPASLLAAFPVQSELNYPDYKALLLIAESLQEQDVRPQDMVSQVTSQIEDICDDNQLTDEEIKDRILACLKKTAAHQKTKERFVTKALWKFTDKDRFARKKTRGRSFSYEFNRLSSELQQELDRVIEMTLHKHLSEPE